MPELGGTPAALPKNGLVVTVPGRESLNWRQRKSSGCGHESATT